MTTRLWRGFPDRPLAHSAKPNTDGRAAEIARVTCGRDFLAPRPTHEACVVRASRQPCTVHNRRRPAAHTHQRGSSRLRAKGALPHSSGCPRPCPQRRVPAFSATRGSACAAPDAGRSRRGSCGAQRPVAFFFHRVALSMVGSRAWRVKRARPSTGGGAGAAGGGARARPAQRRRPCVHWGRTHPAARAFQQSGGGHRRRR